MPLHALLTQDKAALESALSLDAATARIEVQMLLQQALGVSRAYLLAHPERELNETESSRYRELLQRRLVGEPVAHILGEREFFGLNFKVTPATLIPRPDTELLVELALQRIPGQPPSPGLSATLWVKQLAIRLGCKRPQPSRWLSRERERSWGRGRLFRILDLGTGSGAIALSIAHARPDIEVTAVDASEAALEVAQFNMQQLELGNVRLLCSDWFSALHGERFDLIVSNPPYIADDDAHLAQGDLRFEPRSALVSGTDGLDDIRRIIADAKEHLREGGWLLFEHGHDQAERVRGLLDASGYTGVFSARDLSGIERVSGGNCA